MPKTFTKESLIEELKKIRNKGFIESGRHGNQGGVGNTIEDLLGIEENNLPIPNAAEWELKCQRLNTSSLTTLFHIEPSPQALKFVPSILLPHFGWKHKEAGRKYPETEKSFRQTISATSHTDRGFIVKLDEKNKRVVISFDFKKIDDRHGPWAAKVKKARGSFDLDPCPYWGYDDLFHKAGSKLHNCFFIGAEVKKIGGKEHFSYKKIFMLSGLSKEKLIAAITAGDILVDFDARTGHNHGTKFRFRNSRLPELYKNVKEI